MPTSKPFSVKAFLEEWAKREGDKPFDHLVRPVIDLGSVDFKAHEERLAAMVRAQYGVPASMIYGGARSGGKSGRAMELAAQLQAREVRMADAGRIKGRRADWMVIDEAVPSHPNCKSQLIPPGAHSMNVATAHDDMLDALALTMGLVRSDGETDNDFRTRVASIAGNGIRGTAKSLELAAVEVTGVRECIVNEHSPGEITLHIGLEDPDMSAADIIEIREAVMQRVEAVRPAGIAIDFEWDGLNQPSPDPTEEELFISRLRSKILERYPTGK